MVERNGWTDVMRRSVREDKAELINVVLPEEVKMRFGQQIKQEYPALKDLKEAERFSFKDRGARSDCKKHNAAVMTVILHYFTGEDNLKASIPDLGERFGVERPIMSFLSIGSYGGSDSSLLLANDIHVIEARVREANAKFPEDSSVKMKPAQLDEIIDSFKAAAKNHNIADRLMNDRGCGRK